MYIYAYICVHLTNGCKGARPVYLETPSSTKNSSAIIRFREKPHLWQFPVPTDRYSIWYILSDSISTSGSERAQKKGIVSI